MAHVLVSLLVAHLLIFLSNSMTILAAQSINNSEIDQQALLNFRLDITDPLGVLSSWGNGSYCSWRGITCGKALPLRVVSLYLNSLQLAGQLSSSLVNLTSIIRLDLGTNSFHGPIPEELGTLPKLQDLILANNSLSGIIPASLFKDSSRLEVINLKRNFLNGCIPDFHKMAALQTLNLAENQLSGRIPSSIGNISSLRSILLDQNELRGSISESLGQISKLLELDLSFNSLSGYIPLPLYNISSQHFSLGRNGLVGQLPSEIGNSLSNLQVLIMQSNSLEGLIPTSLENMSNLQVLDLSNNSLHGYIPFLGSLANLNQVLLGRNRLEAHDWTFFASLTNCSLLKKLSLEENILKGKLPRSVCNLSKTLDSLLLGFNQISGSIPVGISNLVNLTELSMENNLLSGSIPATIGKMRDLYILNLSKNKLSGRIPSTVGNIAQLGSLFLDDNNLSGSIPNSLGQCLALSHLNLSTNNLNGYIPEQLFFGFSYRPLSLTIDLSHNNLTGELPERMCTSTDLVLLNVSNNLLSGRLHWPGGCSALTSLSMEGNKFQGEIPATFNWLTNSIYINLSRNDLSGNVPEFFENFTMLDQLDLSFNNFEGPIPTRGIFANSTMVHLDGNKRLCSDFPMLSLPPCPSISSDTKTKNHTKHVLIMAVLITRVTIALLLLLFCLFAVWRKMEVHMSALYSNIWYLLSNIWYLLSNIWYILKLVTCWTMRLKCTFTEFIRRWNVLRFLSLRRREVEIFPTHQETLKKVSYGDIAKATNWFSPSHRISSTLTASVYVGRFRLDSNLVAIKVFNLNKHGAHEGYLTECEVLRSIRHRNILKAVTSCSTLDTGNNEFKALVFQFAANGSLERWLHPKQKIERLNRTLSLGQRICIVTDVASALDYLHNQLIPPLVHCDLKPSNVLLDYDMTARVGEFGSAKFLSQHSGGLKHLDDIQGTIGYLAPEYGMGCGITTRGDAYSFGVLLLEMLTGKRPTDEMFVDGLNLHNFTKSLFPTRVAEILDPHMLHEESQLCTEVWMQHYIIPLATLGLSCSMESPKERPGMKDVCAKLSAIKDNFVKSHGQLLNSPSWC